MFHKEGFKIILITLFAVIGISLIAHYFVDIPWLKKLIQIVAFLFLIAILQFFRNPKRITPKNDQHIIAPVDGKVVVIEEVFEKEYFKAYLQGVKSYKLFPSNIFALTRRVLRITSKLLYEFLKKRTVKYYKEGANINESWIKLQTALLPLSLSYSEIERLFEESKELEDLGFMEQAEKMLNDIKKDGK